MRNRRKHREIYRMNFLIGYRNSGRIWLMKVLQKSFGETRCRGVQTLPVRLMNTQMEPQAHVEPGSGKHSVFTHIPKDPNCEICPKTKITRAPCRRRASAVMPRAEHFSDLISADTKFSVKKVHRRTIIDMLWWYKTWQPSGYSPTRAKQNLPRRPRRT